MKLIFFVEGDDDQRFLERIIGPIVSENFLLVRYFRYASSVPKDVCNTLKTLESAGWHYLFLADRDQNTCITKKREAVCEKMQAVSPERIVIVDGEIESWYVSGVDSGKAKTIGIKMPRAVETFSKEHLQRSTNRKFPTATDLKLFLLDNYSLTEARTRSNSLAYLCRKLGI